ncbi:hypothetical protein NQ318_018532 [Aromia moschata]|uniref:DUF659 domain-containing protein n=1 Tax=Aromia moschata TaxID=1265417 RepID=A0AAV8ZFH8_9CUCU|nr:hypothetical protein NQ318_018532 [Aromia moschata]
MFVTDSAATTRVVGRSLQEHSCNMIHVTCTGHALHLVAKTIRQCFPEVNALITMFLKSSKRLRAFQSKCPEPPQLILKRWGTWLEAAFYYDKYFEQIKVVILEVDPNKAAAMMESQTKFQDI